MRIATLTAIFALASMGLAKEHARIKTPTSTFNLTSSDAVVGFGEAESSSGGIASKPDITISGKVRNRKGRPAVGATVILRDAVTGEQRSTTTDKRGRYSFTKIFPGEYSLSATLKDKKAQSKDISVRHNDNLRED